MLLNTLFLIFLPVVLSFPSNSIVKSVSEIKCADALEACNNIQAAHSCKAVQPCIQIWEKLKAPEDNNEICDLCKDMVKQARDQLLSNETQEEIKEVFEGSCNLIPIKALAAECRSVVDQLIPTLIETLASRMDPTMVCTVAGLCNNGELASIMKRQLDASDLAPLLIKAAINDDKCSECESAMTFVKKIMKHIGLDTFTQLSFQACQDQFQGTTAQCARFIVGVLPVVGNISEVDEKKICTLIGSCPDSRPKSDRGCSLCSGFVGAASQLQQLPSAMKSVENFFLDQCTLLESDAMEKCQAAVKSTLQVMQKYLWSKNDPTVECENTGLCSPGKWNFLRGVVLKDTFHSGNSEVCTVCQEVFQFLRDKAMTLKVKVEIEKELDNLCLQLGQLGPTCQAFVDQYFSVIYDAIVEDLTADVVCNALKLCSNEKYSSLKGAIEGFIRLCKTRLHDTKVQCEVLVKDIIPVMFNFFNAMDPPVFCGAMQSCPVNYPLVKPVGDELTCEFCEALVQYVRNTFNTNTTKEEFRTAFTNMCKDLREFSSECSSLVNEYFDQFYDFIIGQMDPKLVCSALGLCDKAFPVAATKMVKLIPAKANPKFDIYPALSVLKQVNRVGLRIIDTQPQQQESRPGIQIHLPASSMKTNRFLTKEDTETNRINVDETINPQVQQLPVDRYFYPSIIAKNDMTCTLCKTIANFLDKELQDQRTEAMIRQALDQVCSYLPKELDAQCTDFINEYTELFVSLIVQEFTPEYLCSLVKACPAGDTTIKAIPIQDNGVFCEVCVKVMQYVEKELESNSTEESIKEALEKACSYLPKSYAVKCQNFMDQYAEMIFELLSKEIAPRAVCSMLGICPFASKNNGDLDCQICQYTLHYIQNLLMDNATAAEIKQGLEKACDELPQKIASECKNYIEEYGDAILALLAQEIDPSVICVKLNICPGGRHQNKVIPSTNVVQNLKIDTCGTCQVVVDYMDKLLENDDIEREITKLVEKVCTIVPKTTRDQCVSIIEAYGPYILQMIGQLADSKEVCQTIDLCARVPGHVHLLGGGKCSFGPTYWCHSFAHAAACKAQLYCKQNVWGA